MERLVGTTIALLAASVIFGLAQRFFSRDPQPGRDRRTFRIDLTYWFFTPLVTKTLVGIAIVMLATVVAIFVGEETLRVAIREGREPITALPAGLQALAALVVGDFVGYWAHRLLHRSRFWKIHAIHHSPKTLDWLAASRLHPLNAVMARGVQALVLVGLGFPAGVLAVYVPFLGFYGLLLHTNVSWDFGPLRRVLASPRFHRWHHTCEEDGLDKNFAGLFPVWDQLFGTYFMPENRRPLQFGVLADDVPESVLGQLAYPFRAAAQTSERVSPDEGVR